jgi:hypothetical protein
LLIKRQEKKYKKLNFNCKSKRPEYGQETLRFGTDILILANMENKNKTFPIKLHLFINFDVSNKLICTNCISKMRSLRCFRSLHERTLNSKHQALFNVFSCKEMKKCAEIVFSASLNANNEHLYKHNNQEGNKSLFKI